MKHTFEIDFALDRHRCLRTRQWLLAGVGLLLGLQFGVNVWRWQSAQDKLTALQTQQRKLSGQGERHVALSAAQIKTASSAQAMLDSLALPWDALLGTIESARTAPVVVDSIKPLSPAVPVAGGHGDGSMGMGMGVGISVSSPDFAGVAGFVDALRQQPGLYNVMLVSETLQDRRSSNMGGLGSRLGVAGLRAEISAYFDPSSH